MQKHGYENKGMPKNVTRIFAEFFHDVTPGC